MIVLCKEVESLMSATEPKLTAQLNKIMQISESKGNDKDKLSFVFHKQLLQLVHPFLQRMFVGMLRPIFVTVQIRIILFLIRCLLPGDFILHS